MVREWDESQKGRYALIWMDFLRKGEGEKTRENSQDGTRHKNGETTIPSLAN